MRHLFDNFGNFMVLASGHHRGKDRWEVIDVLMKSGWQWRIGVISIRFGIFYLASAQQEQSRIVSCWSLGCAKLNSLLRKTFFSSILCYSVFIYSGCSSPKRIFQFLTCWDIWPDALALSNSGLCNDVTFNVFFETFTGAWGTISLVAVCPLCYYWPLGCIRCSILVNFEVNASH